MDTVSRIITMTICGPKGGWNMGAALDAYKRGDWGPLQAAFRMGGKFASDEDIDKTIASFGGVSGNARAPFFKETD